MSPDRRHSVYYGAWQDIDAAEGWYFRHSPELSDRFLAEIDNALEEIVRFPHRWPQHLRGTRRFLLTNFPFSIIYRVRTEVIEIVAVAHHKRRPGYWRKRL